MDADTGKSPGRDEASLIARVRGGDTGAFEELIRPYEGRVYQVVLRITQNPSDAADVHQEAMIAAFEKLDAFRGDAAFATWLHRIAVNRALMRRRSATQNREISEEDLPKFNRMGMHRSPVLDWSASAEAPVLRHELRTALSQALDQLPEVERAIVWLKDAEGFDHEQIAQATGLTVSATRSRLHRAHLWLRQRLAEHAGSSR